MNLSDAIQWLALRDVYFSCSDLEGVDPGYELRRVFRWYSRTFATPLHEVQNLPVEDVLRAYFEQKFEEMEDEKLEQLVREVAISPERMREIEREEDRRAVEDLEFEGDAKEESERVGVEKVVMPVRNALEGLLSQVRSQGREAVLFQDRPSAPKVEPGIKMTFVSEEEMEKDLERDSFGLFEDPRKKR